jgi:hypothetical protein
MINAISTQMKTVFCDGSTHVINGPKTTVKKLRKVPGKMDRYVRNGVKSQTAAIMYGDELPKGVSPDAHPVKMIFESRMTRTLDWTEIWSTTLICECGERFSGEKFD